MVDFRSDKERVARSARLTKRAVKEQTQQARVIGRHQAELLRQQLALQHQTAMATSVTAAALVHQMPPQPAVAPPPTVPTGWYDDQGGAALQHYWDGALWTGHTRPNFG